jgi:hypothetical protein
MRNGTGAVGTGLSVANHCAGRAAGNEADQVDDLFIAGIWLKNEDG